MISCFRHCDADEYFAYNTVNTQLNYDADGIGGVHSTLLIVTIGAPRLLLTSADILINL